MSSDRLSPAYSNPLSLPVDVLRRRHFRPLITPGRDGDPLSQGLVRHGLDEHGRPVVDVLVLRTVGTSAVLRARPIHDEHHPLDIIEPYLVYRELDCRDAVDFMIELTDPTAS